MKRIAFYGGSFDPLHNGHVAIARALTASFKLDEFVFLPAFHAPHKKSKKPTSAFHRHAMLALTTAETESFRVSTIELELPERPYTFETLSRLGELFPSDRLFFVMGADSWRDITTWFRWEEVLLMTDIIVVTRPGYELGAGHVTDAVRARLADVRGNAAVELPETAAIFWSDAVELDISATEIRAAIREGQTDWRREVPLAVANYIEKYELYT